MRLPSSVVAGGVTTMILLATYLATAAPDLTFWDAPELIAAAQTLGIPHPPGTPLWVLLAHSTARLFSETGPARAVTMLSVLASAIAGGLGALMAARWIGARAAVAAAVMAGTMWSVWNNATEAEVYAVALALSVLMLYAGERAGRPHVDESTRARWRALVVFIAALSVPLHLSVLVALPATIALAWRGARPTWRDVFSWIALGALALSAIAILPLLAARTPAIDSGHPVTVSALLDVLQRKQYAVAGLWPRTTAWWLQIGNVFEWADWQVAFGLHPEPAPSLTRTSLSLAWCWLAVLGVRELWRHEARVGRAWLILLVSGSFGVACWLNMHAGPSYGAGVLPATAVHEARERDYFFVLSFWGWGIAAGAGLAAVVRQLSRRIPAPMAVLPYAFAAVPLLANRPSADRTREPASSLPRVYARALLDAMPPNGVLYTAGDNDSFPLWYLQAVEGQRPDVSVVTTPLMGAAWYRRQLYRREHLLPPAAVEPWSGLEAVLRSSAIQATLRGRPIRASAMLSASDRRGIEPTLGWVLQGLVYAPSNAVPAGTVGLDLPALTAAQNRVPPAVLMSLPRGTDPGAISMQDLLRCTAIRVLTDTLLVKTCNGS